MVRHGRGNMKMFPKYLFLFAMPLMASVGVVHAAETASPAGERDRPRMREMREQRMQQLAEKLSLTAEQKTRINAIWDAAQKSARAAREEMSEDVQTQVRAKRREAMKAVHQEVRAVLTPEQQTIFDALPPDRPAGGPRSGGPRRGGEDK